MEMTREADFSPSVQELDRANWIALLLPLNDFLNALECPVNLLAGNDEGWGDADDAVMCFFAQDSLLLQRFAVRPRRAVHLDSDPQAAAADFAQIAAAQRAQALQKIGA